MQKQYTYSETGGVIADRYEEGLRTLSPWVRGHSDPTLYNDDPELLTYSCGQGVFANSSRFLKYLSSG
ncbi:MAG: hypothetical protein ACNA7G_14250 [Methylobacter sp.]